MTNLRYRALAITASALLLAGMAWAQSDTMQNDKTMAKPSTGDRSFMMKAAEGGMAEVKLGQLAQQNGQSQEVKDFGQRMVTDHGKANDELKQVAQKQNVTLPDKCNATDQATYNRLQKLHGVAFDKAYMKDMVSDHEKDVAEFKTHEKTAKDADLKQWVSSTLPTLEDHLAQAKKVASGMGSGQNTSAGMSGAPSK
jgi:putative membrane protein